MNMSFARAGFVLSVLFVSALPALLFAHATPITYTPGAGTTELGAPSSISIRFTERIETLASSLTVFGPHGEEVQQGKGEVGGEDGRTFSVGINDAGEGVYTISWQVVSIDDGHFTKGAYSFLVDAAGTKFEGNAGGIEVTYVTRIPEAVFNFFGLLGESIYLAGILFLMLVLRPLYRAKGMMEPEWGEITSRYRHLMTFGFLFLVFGSIAVVYKKTEELAGLQGLSFFDGLPVYLLSSGGLHTLLKVLLGTFFIALFLFAWRKIFASHKATYYEWILLLLTVGILYLQSNISHAAASFFYPKVSIFITVFHLFAKELIIGISVIILTLFTVFAGKAGFGSLRRMLPRYDVIAAISILLAGLSGVYVTWLHLKRFEHLFDTDWGIRFIALLLLTLVLGSVRVLHQFVVHPLIGRNEKIQSLYRITLPVEVGIGLAVLFFSGYLSITTPPFIVEGNTFSVAEESEGVAVTLEAHPYEKDTFRILLQDSADGTAIPAPKLTVTATNHGRGVGPNVLSTEERFPGGYTFLRQDLSPPGNWNISVIAAQPGGYDAYAQYSFSYPDDVSTMLFSDEFRAYDDFTKRMLIIAVVVVLASCVLFGHALWQVRWHDAYSAESAPLTPSFTSTSVLLSGVLTIVILGVAYGAYYALTMSDFRQTCQREGNEWRQSYPTRNFETVSSNSVIGCFVHDGHYHFIDEREYRSYMDSL